MVKTATTLLTERDVILLLFPLFDPVMVSDCIPGLQDPQNLSVRVLVEMLRLDTKTANQD